jgi:glycosyltransferase involved in cell wall biosynthesis
MRIVFLTRSIAGGGAERQLLVLAQGLVRLGHRCSIVTFYAPENGGMPPGLRIVSLSKRGRWDLLSFSLRLVKVIREEHPHVLHGYLTVPNIMAALVGFLIPRATVVFGIRASNMDLQRYDRASRWTHWLEARLVRSARAVIVNSQAGRRSAIERGIREDKLFLIRNGIDVDAFRFEEEARWRLRERWKFKADEIILGVVARLDPMKDHATFLRAFTQAARDVPKLRAIFVGDGPASLRRELEKSAASLGISDAISWAGVETDMVSVYSGIDVLCLASAFGEGMPNVVAEAMACERVCIVTDVGDARDLVADFGFVVPPAMPEALAAAIRQVATMSEARRLAMGQGARRRIQEAYTIGELVSRTSSVLGSISGDID